MTARRAIFIAPFDALSEPGLVAEVGSQSGRGRPSGAPIEAPLAAITGFAEGKIIRIEVHPTHAEALEAVGLRE